MAIPLDIPSASAGFIVVPILLDASFTAPINPTIGFIRALNALVPNHIRGIANIADAKNRPKIDSPATEAKIDSAILAAPPSMEETPSTTFVISSEDSNEPAIEPAIPIIEEAKDRTTGVNA